ncbi:hypothetical protein [Nocardia terpenica]|uniref:hypothetical protein n=1 Tax=Nocardia terpenica TaxID=455432 RepID=UPI00031D49F6|nr:hypothetical protein [Nocardia terpenica]NQE92603.1 hypothetical protein [Nocardia terpenica]
MAREPFEIASDHMDRGVAVALSTLDEAFDPVRPPVAIDCCPHCKKVDDYAAILTRPRRLLTGIEYWVTTPSVHSIPWGPTPICTT